MRTIKFRGNKLTNGVWAYGSSVYLDENAAAGEGKKHIGISGGNIWTLSETMCDYTFADGEPFGINIEEE